MWLVDIATCNAEQHHAMYVSPVVLEQLHKLVTSACLIMTRDHFVVLQMCVPKIRCAMLMVTSLDSVYITRELDSFVMLPVMPVTHLTLILQQSYLEQEQTHLPCHSALCQACSLVCCQCLKWLCLTTVT